MSTITLTTSRSLRGRWTDPVVQDADATSGGRDAASADALVLVMCFVDDEQRLSTVDC